MTGADDSFLTFAFFFFFWCCHQTPDKPPPANQLTLPIVILLWLPFHFSTEPIVAPINQLRIIWPSSITSPDYYNDFPSKLSASKFLWLHSLKGRLAKRSITARAWERRGEQIDKKERQFHQPRNSDDILLTSVDLLDGTREKQRLTESHPIRRLSFVGSGEVQLLAVGIRAPTPRAGRVFPQGFGWVKGGGGGLSCKQ